MSSQAARTKYDGLVTDAVISAHEYEMATRNARRQGVDVEDVLTDDMQYRGRRSGARWPSISALPYEAFNPDRLKPLDLLKNLKRDYAEQNHWLPIEDTSESSWCSASIRNRSRASRVVQDVFPKRKLVFHVTTVREFQQTVDQFFGESIEDVHVGELLSGLD